MNTIFGLSKQNGSFLMIAAGLIIIFLDLNFLVRNTIKLWHLLTAFEQKASITIETLFVSAAIALILHALVPRTVDEKVVN